MKVERILCPIDFSEGSERAADYAVDLAQAVGADVFLLHVWSLSARGAANGAMTVIDAARHAEQTAASRLEHDRERFLARPVRVHARMVEGSAKVEILRFIDEIHASLVVVATRGHRDLSSLLLGSVAERVVRLSPVPVLTVRA